MRRDGALHARGHESLGYLGNETVSATCPSGHDNRWFPKLGLQALRSPEDE